MQTVDPELEQKVMSLEVFLRQLIHNVNTWQEDLQVRLTFDPSPRKLCPLHRERWTAERLGEGMVLYVTSDLRPLTCYQRSVSELQQAVKTQASLS